MQDSAGMPINHEHQTSYGDDRQESTLNMSGSKGSKASLIPSRRDSKVKREFGKSGNQVKNAVSTSKISRSSSDHSQMSNNEDNDEEQSKETVSSHVDIKNIAPMRAPSSIKQTNLQVNTNLQ